MDKKTFMRQLERSLSVLQEDELKDIMGEYEQHIDMKVQRGLTEEEAIADFGSLQELTAEILEAYHVRADYAAEAEKGKRNLFAGGEKAGKEILEQTGELCAKTGRQTMKGLRRFGVWLLGVLLFWKAQVARPFAWMKRKLEAYRKGMPEGKETKIESGSILVKGAKKAAGVFRFFKKAAGWCIHAVWSLCWAGFSLFCGVLGLFGLFGLGMLVVLLLDGYPLAGAMIGCLGLNLCLFGAAGLGMTFLRKWKDLHRLKKILLGVFLCGVLLGGVGTGAAFVEYSSITYAGEKKIGGEAMVTKNFDFSLDTGKGIVKVVPVWYDGKQLSYLEPDASVPEGVIRYRVTYNTKTVTPYLEFSENDGQGYLYLEEQYQDDFALWMENKDEILSDLKQGKVSSYRTDYITDVKVLVNPASEAFVEQERRY